MNFCPGRSECTLLWPEEGGFDASSPSKAGDLWLPLFAQHAVLYVSSLILLKKTLNTL